MASIPCYWLRGRDDACIAPRVSSVDMEPANDAVLSQQLVDLKTEHRDLDLAIARLQADIEADELAVKRMKKRKLMLKDAIARLESDLIPDEPA